MKLDGKWGLWVATAALAALLLMYGGNEQSLSEEGRIAQVLGTIAGAGKVEVALFYAPKEQSGFSQEAGPPTGAVVVAQGADDWEVRLQLIRAVRTLLGLPEEAVDVFVMEGSE